MRVEQVIEVFFNISLWRLAFPQLLTGLKMTVLLASVTIALATPIGLLIAIVRTTHLRPMSWLFTLYVDVLRPWPALVLLLLIHSALPFVGIRFTAYTSAVLALTLLNSAFISEVFRSGIESVHRGQIEAARALGLGPAQTMWFIVLPQALRVALPPLTSNFIALVKDTALAATIAVPELLRQARLIQGVYMNPSPLVAAGVIYLAMLVPLVRLVALLERRSARLATSSR